MQCKTCTLINTLFLLHIINLLRFITMKRVSLTSLCVLVVVTMALLTGIRLANAVDCDPSELGPCLAAITSPSTQPSTACCLKMKEQTPCFCGYFNNPSLKPYIGGGQRVAADCGVDVPSC